MIRRRFTHVIMKKNNHDVAKVEAILLVMVLNFHPRDRIVG
jgi:hypothetical protein